MVGITRSQSPCPSLSPAFSQRIIQVYQDRVYIKSARTIYIWCSYLVFFAWVSCFIKHTVKYSACVRSWPTLCRIQNIFDQNISRYISSAIDTQCKSCTNSSGQPYACLYVPYIFYDTPHKYGFLPCGMTVVSFSFIFFDPAGFCGMCVIKVIGLLQVTSDRRPPRPPPGPPPPPSRPSSSDRSSKWDELSDRRRKQ
jgi:hypothetical protein